MPFVRRTSTWLAAAAAAVAITVGGLTWAPWTADPSPYDQVVAAADARTVTSTKDGAVATVTYSRRLGRSAFPAFMQSRAGRMMFELAAPRLEDALARAPQAYAVISNAGTVYFERRAPRIVEIVFVGFPGFLETYQVGIVEGVCSHYGERVTLEIALETIADGTIRAAGSRTWLREQYTLPRYAIEVESDAGWLRDEPGVTLLELDGHRAVFDLDQEADDQAVLRSALARGPVRSFAPVRPSLAEIFREVIQ